MFKNGSDYDVDLRTINPYVREGRTKGKPGKSKYVFEGKNVRIWAEELGIPVKALMAYFKEHNTVYGYEKPEPWNKGKKAGPRAKASIEKQAATIAERGPLEYNEERSAKISAKAKDRWSDPEWVASNSHKGRKATAEQRAKSSAAAKKRWANTPKGPKVPNGRAKQVNTPKGIFTVDEASVVYGVKPATIYAYINRETEKWAAWTWAT